MDLSKKIEIGSSPSYVFRCLLNPDELKKWWQCNAVVETSVGRPWILGWGIDENGLGSGSVIMGFVQEFELNKLFSVFIDPITLSFGLEEIEHGTELTIIQRNYPEGEDAEGSLGTWVDVISALKVYVEEKYPKREKKETGNFKSTKESQTVSESELNASRETGSRKTLNVSDMKKPSPFESTPSNDSESILENRGSKSGLYVMGSNEISHAIEPYEMPVEPEKPSGPTEEPADGFKVLDDGGFPITDPWGVVKSWKKEHGFGYVDHPQIGDVMFDYDGCDFEPAEGDKVLLLKIKKTWNGKPKCKRIACPAKGSKVDK